MTRIEIVYRLCREYKRIHPRKSVFPFWCKLCGFTTPELQDIAYMVLRFGADSFGYGYGYIFTEDDN